MKKINLLLLVNCLFILGFLLSSCGQNEAKLVLLKISCGVSMKNTLEDVRLIYIRQNSKINIIYNFQSSGDNKKNIEDGDNVDIFITAGSQFMDELQAKGLIIPETRKKILSNKIVSIAPKTDTSISSFKDLADPKIKHIAIANPTTGSSGFHGEEVLKFFSILEQVKPKLILTRNGDEALKLVEQKKANAGILYATDAIASSQVKIVAIAPQESHSPINYNIAIIKSSQNVSAAKDFIKFMQSEQAGALFVKYGFTVTSSSK